MPDYLIRLNDCPLLVLTVPHTAALGEHDVRLLAREWLLGSPLPAEVHMAEVGPDQLATPDAIGEDGPRCLHCGCTDERPCPGGCFWVPGPMDGEMCSRCLALLTLVAAALDDAAGWRDLRSSAPCEACASAAGGRCAEHQADEDRAAAYRELLAARYSAYLADSVPAGGASAILHAE